MGVILVGNGSNNAMTKCQIEKQNCYYMTWLFAFANVLEQ